MRFFFLESWDSQLFVYASNLISGIYVAGTGVWLMHCHFDVHLSWGLRMAWIVEDGKLPNQKLPPPPADLPKCWLFMFMTLLGFLGHLMPLPTFFLPGETLFCTFWFSNSELIWGFLVCRILPSIYVRVKNKHSIFVSCNQSDILEDLSIHLIFKNLLFHSEYINALLF